jgi:2-polyprenyl-3-methyl-5-hydroxy-6-metoxy-1,4-benzoquinol methylase
MPEASRVLRENLHLLPQRGDALDLACGLGASALMMARAGLRVQAWDLSQVALDSLAKEASRTGIRISLQCRDVIVSPPQAESFDIIHVSYFLDRGLVPRLIQALRPGGLIFYQTFTRAAVSDTGPSNPEYRLKDNELLHLFPGLLIRCYCEEGRLGDLRSGCRDVALLVAEKKR